jgi:hypothetical protein
MKYRYFLVMNSIYDQVMKNPFQAHDLPKDVDTKNFIALRDKFYIRKAVCSSKNRRLGNVWRITEFGEKMLKKYRRKFLPSSEDCSRCT